MPELDHLVLASPDPLATQDLIAERTGVVLSAGGPHVGRGTRNWLGRLGRRHYLELIGPDPEQPEPSAPRSFGLDHVGAATLVTWAARHDDLDGLRTSAAAAGIALGAPFEMARDAPGGRLHWRLALPEIDTAGGIVPFFIDWQDSTHPSETAAAGLALVDVVAQHPDPAAVQGVLAALGVDLPVTVGPIAGLRATLRGPRGDLSLGPSDAS